MIQHKRPTAQQSKRSRRVYQTAWCILLGLTLAGCGEQSMNDLQTYVQQVKNRQKGNIPPLPKPQEYEKFAYNSASLRDPFEPPEDTRTQAARTTNGLQPDLDREREPLEQFALGSLRMVGSIEKDGKRWALIMTPDGTLHRITYGHHVGQDNGKIERITETEIELKEIVPDGLGGWIERRTTLSASR